MEITFNKIIVDQKNCRKKVCSVHVENTCRTAEAKRMIKAYNKKQPNSQLDEILFGIAFIFLCTLGIHETFRLDCIVHNRKFGWKFIECGNPMTSKMVDWKIQTDLIHVKTIQWWNRRRLGFQIHHLFKHLD